jgi:hypothetical protein
MLLKIIRFLLYILIKHTASVHEGKKAFKCGICDYSCYHKSDMKKHFERHALESHNRAKSFFIKLNDKKSENNTSNKSEPTVKEDTLSESEGEESIQSPKSYQYSQDSITDDPIKTLTDNETFDTLEEKLKTFDDQKLEELQNFDGENYEDIITDAETSDDETFDSKDKNKCNMIEEKNNIIEEGKKRKRNSEVERELKVILQKIPTPKKSHKCPTCQKAIATPSDLKRHINTVHEKKKEHKCEMCPSEFTRKNTLANHIKTVHFFDRDFACNQCDLKFSSRSNLKFHTNEVHENIEYKCNLCNCSYKRKTRLKAHIKNVH